MKATNQEKAQREFPMLTGVELPLGAADLDQRELVFLRGLLSHGQQGKAALEAGYGRELKTAAVKACEILKRPHVQIVYRRMLAPLSEDAKRIVMAKTELSIAWNARAQEAAQAAAMAGEKIRELQRAGVQPWENVYVQAVRVQEEAQADERHYAKLANDTDTLLASLLGKLKLHIEGNLNLNVNVGDAATSTFWQLARTYREQKAALKEVAQRN